MLVGLAITAQGQTKTYRVEVEQQVQGTNLLVSMYITKITGADFALGSANFSIFMTGANLNIGGLTIDPAGKGPFDAANNPSDYMDMFTSLRANYFALNIARITGSGTSGVLVTSTRTLIARMIVPITNPAGFNTITWRLIPMDVMNWGSNRIKDLGEFVTPAPNFPLSPPTPLPLTLLSFDGKWRANTFKQAELNWTAADLQATARFVVERSTDGQAWADAGAVAIDNNSRGVQSFSYVDTATALMAQNRFYYRLRGEDLNGDIDYSNQIELAWAPSTTLQLVAYPNPLFKGQSLVIRNTGEGLNDLNISIVDMLGKQVYAQNTELLTTGAELRIATDKFAIGAYVVQVQTETGTAKFKFLVQ